MNQKPIVIYLHVPKTGGTTLSHILDWNYPRVHVINHYDQIPPFLALPDDEKRGYDCLRGQIFYGFHAYLPQPATYITMLRHPVKRFVSQYHYTMARRKRENMPDSDLTMEQFLESEPFQAHMQLSLLRGGTSIDDALKTPLGADTLAVAQAHVEAHFTLAGVLDYYDEMLVLMKRALGWSRAYYARRNTRTEAAPPLTDAQRRLVEAACAPDLELYEWVKARMESTLARQGDDFHAELAALKRKNRLFGFAHAIAEPLHRTPIWNTMRGAAKRVLRR
jgi:hypothetical protein